MQRKEFKCINNVFWRSVKAADTGFAEIYTNRKIWISCRLICVGVSWEKSFEAPQHLGKRRRKQFFVARLVLTRSDYKIIFCRGFSAHTDQKKRITAEILVVWQNLNRLKNHYKRATKVVVEGVFALEPISSFHKYQAPWTNAHKKKLKNHKVWKPPCRRFTHRLHYW